MGSECTCRKHGRCAWCMERERGFKVIKLPDATREILLKKAGLDTWSGTRPEDRDSNG